MLSAISLVLFSSEDSQQGWTRVFLQPTDQFEVHVPPYKEARVGRLLCFLYILDEKLNF